MKNLVRFAVATALMGGFATAQAQTPALPSSGSADLWLFVSDSATNTTFAEDTGILLSNILPTTSLVSGAVLNTSVSASFSLGASSALTAYINSADAAGQSADISWAVLGAQYPSSNTNGNDKKAGNALEIASAPTSSGTGVSNQALGSLNTIVGDFNGDVTYLNGTYAAGGAVYAWSTGTNGGNVWGANTGANGGSTNLYGQSNGVTQAGIGLGSSTGLYGLTGNGGTGQLQSYVLGSNLELSSTGLLTVGSTSTSPVPLPAAVWLFGSGLLGLIGVGRRRAATQA
jgi:hypothetical protein